MQRQYGANTERIHPVTQKFEIKIQLMGAVRPLERLN